MKIVTPDNWFQVQHKADNISLIYEPYIRPFYRCNIWYVSGRDKGALIDTGSGLVSLREQIPLLTEKPVCAIASHTHFDHIGGHHEFSERLVHADEAQILADPNAGNTLAARFVSDEMFEAHPGCQMCYAKYQVKAAPATRTVADADVIDLGNRVLEVIHTPGHSPGGISLWERSTQTLFSGDVLYDGPLIEDAYHSDEDQYRNSLERLLTLPVKTVHGGHFPSFSGERLKTLTIDWLNAHSR